MFKKRNMIEIIAHLNKEHQCIFNALYSNICRNFQKIQWVRQRRKNQFRNYIGKKGTNPIHDLINHLGWEGIIGVSAVNGSRTKRRQIAYETGSVGN